MKMSLDFFKQIICALDSPLYVTDTAGIILYVNPAFEEVTGYRQEELIGNKTSIIKSGKMPDSYYKKLWNTLLSGKTWKEEIINRKKDGSEYVVLQYVTPVFDNREKILFFAAAQYDITREKELQDERDVFFDVSVDLFCILEENRNFKQLNSAWESILGWTFEDLAGKPFEEILHPEDKDNFSSIIDGLLGSYGIVSLDVRLLTAGKAFRWVSLRIHFHEDKQLFYASGRDIQERVEMEEQIRKISITDALTGSYNRLKFNEEFEKELARAKRYKTPCALILLDIDHFKNINDTFGHGTGDEILKDLTRVVQKHLRETDIYCRWGGEEFVIICPHTTSEDAYSLSERVRQAVASNRFKQVGQITISLGVGSFKPGQDTEQLLLNRTDAALYAAKEQGRNRSVRAE